MMAGVAQRYDRIGHTYGEFRRADPRVAEAIRRALGGAASVVDVGSGTASYGPRSLAQVVVAVEPSVTMIRQRPSESAPVIRAVSEALPLATASFDAALAVLTVHHWSDPSRGLIEMRRVAGRQVVLTWDPEVYSRFWLVEEYLPEIAERERSWATVATVADLLPGSVIETVPVPWDCTDGFGAAYWRRPERYLEPAARQAISGLALCPPEAVDLAMRQLASDLHSGAWAERHRELLTVDNYDAGYRLVIAGGR